MTIMWYLCLWDRNPLHWEWFAAAVCDCWDCFLWAWGTSFHTGTDWSPANKVSVLMGSGRFFFSFSCLVWWFHRLPRRCRKNVNGQRTKWLWCQPWNANHLQLQLKNAIRDNRTITAQKNRVFFFDRRKGNLTFWGSNKSKFIKL